MQPQPQSTAHTIAKMSLTETFDRENKAIQVGTDMWRYQWTKAVAAMFNSNGGVIRAGVNRHGQVVPGQTRSDYHPEKSRLATLLAEYLDPVPSFDATDESEGYVAVTIYGGVWAPCILKVELPDPSNNRLIHPPGTAFIRCQKNGEPSSEPIKSRSDWHRALLLWEGNRGVTIQGNILIQFALLVNEWNPFDNQQTETTKNRAMCLAGVAAMLGREKLESGLGRMIDEIKPSNSRPTSEGRKNLDGRDYKQTIADAVARLSIDLGLSIPRQGVENEK